MSSGNNDRFEYLRQPHVVVIAVLVLLALVFAVFTAVKRIQSIQHVASLDTYHSCREFIDDEQLCRFAEKDNQNPRINYSITSTTTDGSTTEITLIEVETEDRIKSVTHNGPVEIEAYIIMDSVSYVKDSTDGTWATYDDPSYTPSEPLASTYDFSSATASGTNEFRNNYHAEGKESCGDLTCYKYRVMSSEDPATTSYIWFDDTDFLLRRHMMVTETTTTNDQFSYAPIKITAPSPTKTVTEEEFSSFLGE